MERLRLQPPDDPWDWATPAKMSQGLKVGNFVYVSGQTATEDGRVQGEGDIGVQTRLTFENIRRILRAGGAEMKHVVKLNTYYVYDGEEADIGDYFRTMLDVRKEFLEPPGPVGSAVRIHGLSIPGLLIEVDAVAILPGDD